MRKFAILFLLLTAFAAAQTKYFLPFSVQQSNGRPINGANVDLYSTGTSTKVYDLTYQDNSPGQYYNTAAFAEGVYDLYVNGVAVMTRISLGGSVSTADVAGLITDFANDSLTASNGVVYVDRDFSYKLVPDTATLKAYSASTNTTVYYGGSEIGQGGFIKKASGYVSDGANVFSSSGGGYWVRKEIVERRGYFDPKWWGASSSASAATNVAAIQAAITQAIGGGSDSAEVVFSGFGSYDINGKIIIANGGNNANGITIRSMPGVTLNLVADDTLFEITGFVSRFTIRDLHIRGHAGAGMGIYHGSTTTGSDYIIEYCKFDSLATGIHLEDITNIRIQNNYFDRSALGLRAGFNSDAWLIDNNIFNNLDTMLIVDGSSADGVTLSNNTFGYSDVGYVHTGGGGFSMYNNYWEGVIELGKVGTGVSGNRNIIIMGDTYQTQGLTTTGFTFLDFDQISVLGIKENSNISGVLFDVQHVNATFSIEGSYGGDSVKFKNDNDYRYLFSGKRVSYNTRDVEIRNANLANTNTNNPVWEERFYSSSGHTIYNYRKTGATVNTTTWHQGLKDVGGTSGLMFIQPGAVIIGDTTIATGAGLELKSTARAILPSRMATTQRDAISAAFSTADSAANQGMFLFDTTIDSLFYWTGTGWRAY